MGLLPLLHFAAGAALVAASLLIPRHIAKARLSSLPAVLLDIAPLLLGAALLLLATGRPLFAGVIILAAGAGFALADDTMRDTLHEPVVFSEAVELPQVFTHPQLYLPFAGPSLVIGGALGALFGALALLFLEPPLWPPRVPRSPGLHRAADRHRHRRRIPAAAWRGCGGAAPAAAQAASRFPTRKNSARSAA